MSENMNDDFGLSQFDEEYASAEVEERDFEDIPDGKFQRLRWIRIELGLLPKVLAMPC